MKKMKYTKFLFILSILFCYSVKLNSQAEIINGPALDNDRDSRMNRLLKGEGDDFYAYRVRSRGKGTSFFVEKYSKAALTPVFSREINLNFENDTKIVDVEYSSGNVFVFRSQYNKDENKLYVFYQTVSSKGNFSETLKEISNITTSKSRFSSVHVYPNPSQTKFLIKISYKKDKDSPYKTDFILIDAVNQKKLWSKTVTEKLFTNTEGKSYYYISSGAYYASGVMIEQEDIGFIGMHLDDEDNVYYAVSSPAKNWTENDQHFVLNVGIFKAKDTEPKTIELSFSSDYFIRDVEFVKTNKNEMSVGGFLKETTERKGADLVKVGVFNFSIDLESYSVKSKSLKLFDDEILKALESNVKRSRYFKYKLDYMMPIGDDIYFVGEQYKEEMYVTQRGTVGVHGGTSGTTDADWRYEYMDVIIAKLNKSGQFEWVKNLPLRQKVIMTSAPHVFKQYIAFGTSNFIYMLSDDHPKNIELYEKADYEPKDLKTVSGIHGSNFVCNQLNLKTGEIKRKVLMKNEDYCFAPIQERNPSFIPPSDCEIFVPSGKNEIYIYTEDAGRDRFAKIKFD